MTDHARAPMLRALALVSILGLSHCGGSSPAAPTTAPANTESTTPDGQLERIADDYLRLELAMAVHDSAHVDAYFGPEKLREEAQAAGWDLATLDARATSLAAALEPHTADDAPDAAIQRARGLLERLTALRTRVAFKRGHQLGFDEESRQLFGARAPDHDAAHFTAILADIEAILPGDGSGDDSLSARVEAFKSRFVIAADRLPAVFDAAIAECRRRTLEHIELPEGESFVVEYVSDKPWSGYNWYKGQAHSVIQVNTDLPIFISRAVDLGCHEGYPGHHTFNAIVEERLVRGRGWQEYSLYPLFSPQSLIAEGSGNYGIELAFPGSERVEFEKRVLFPLARLDTADADRYYQLERLLQKLNYAGNEAARDYLDGRIDRPAAIRWLVDYALMSEARAQQRTEFIDAYRSYVINYNLGKDLVREFVERDTTSAAERWQRFEALLADPRM